MKINLGDKVKDAVSGLTGVVTSHTRWLTGCDSYGVTPQELKDGKPVDASHIDGSRLTVLKAALIKLKDNRPDDGGPHDSISRTR